MVNANIILLAVGGFLFFSLGGLKSVSGFLGSDLVNKNQQDASGEVVVDNLQSSASIPIPQGSQNTVNTILASRIIREPIVSKQKLNQNANKPQIKTTFFDLKSGGSRPQIGQTVSTNSSAGLGFSLKQSEVDNIRKQPFTTQEKADIVALQNRFNRKDPATQKLKDSPEEVIFKKREQEAIARKTLGTNNFVFSGGQRTRSGAVIEQKGGLFGKANFALGGVTPAQFQKQQEEKQQQQAKIEQNKILQEQRQKSGTAILSTIAKSSLNQKEFLQKRGINLNTGNLNAKALARLAERGLI